MLHKFLRSTTSSLSVVLFFVLANVHVSTAADWPQFRGPNSTGVYSSKHELPTTFSGTENVKWSAPLGDGIGCPVVANGKVFVASMVDEKNVGLHAFDSKTGKTLWTRQWHTPNLIPVHKLSLIHI